MRPSTVWLTLLSIVSAVDIPSFKLPDFPRSTIDNDGTHAGRYDVRKTMVWRDPDTNNLNSHAFLLWLTLCNGRKYHVFLAPNLYGTELTTGIFKLEDLQDLTSSGATVFAPGSGSNDSLNLQSAIQNYSSPAGGDNYSDLYIKTDYAGVKLNLHFAPTGKNLYIGGGGGVDFVTNNNSTDYSRLTPGYSWYWGNPTLRVDGTVNIDGQDVAVNTTESRGYFERQTGFLTIPGGYFAFWLYLSNDVMLHVWVVGPTLDKPFGVPAWATVWHPNGLHEIVEVDNTTTATDVWTSEITGKTYFNDFVLQLSTRNASFNIHQVIRESELNPLNDTTGYSISESYGQGDGIWDGEEVTFYGHVEQLSYW